MGAMIHIQHSVIYYLYLIARYYDCGPLAGKLFVIAVLLNCFVLLLLQWMFPSEVSISCTLMDGKS